MAKFLGQEGQEARDKKVIFNQKSRIFLQNQGVLNRPRVSFGVWQYTYRIQCIFISLSTEGPIEPDISGCLRNKSEIFNFVYLISIQPKYQKVLWVPPALVPYPPHILTEFEKYAAGADSEHVVTSHTVRRWIFSEGGVQLPGAVARQARCLWVAVPWPDSLKRVVLGCHRPYLLYSVKIKAEARLNLSLANFSAHLSDTLICFSGFGLVSESPD